MRFRICIRGRVRPSVRPSIRLSVGRSVTHELNFWEKAEFEQNSTSNMKLCHLKEVSRTSTRARIARMHVWSNFSQTCSIPFSKWKLAILTWMRWLPLPVNDAPFSGHIRVVCAVCIGRKKKYQFLGNNNCTFHSWFLKKNAAGFCADDKLS